MLCLLFLPAYFQGELLTAYQLIDRRFGPKLHKVTAAIFLLTRAAAEGMRLFAISILIGIAIGTSDIASIVIITVLTLLYTIKGGMAAVIWTDVMQMFIFIGGSFAALWALGHQVPGGWSMIHQAGQAAGKFTVFHFALNLTTTYTFWTGLIGGCFLTMASHGTDQLMVQRLLAAKNLRESRLALLSSWFIVALQFLLFLCVGAGLYVYYTRVARGLHFQSRPDLSRVHCRSHACGRFGIDHRGCFGRSYVQFKRRTQFTFFHHGCRLLYETSPQCRGSRALQCFTYLHVVLGGCIVRACFAYRAEANTWWK